MTTLKTRLTHFLHFCQAYVDFMLTTTLPPPFSIFSIFRGLKPVTEYIKVLLKPPPGKRARWDFINCCYIVSMPSFNIDLMLFVIKLNIDYRISIVNRPDGSVRLTCALSGVVQIHTGRMFSASNRGLLRLSVDNVGYIEPHTV